MYSKTCLSGNQATCIKQACIQFRKQANTLKFTCIKQASVLSKQSLIVLLNTGWTVIESVSEGFLTYKSEQSRKHNGQLIFS